MRMWIVAAALLLASASLAQDQVPAGALDFVRAQRAYRKRDIEGAIRAFERALRTNPDLFLSHYYLGYAYQSKKDWEKTGENFADFLRHLDLKDPKTAGMHFWANRQAGLAFARTSTSSRAIPHLEKTVAEKPDDKDARFFLGVALYKSENRTRAKEQFSKVLTLDPKFGEAHYYSGLMALDEKDGAEARKRLETFLDLDPNSPHAADAHFVLGALALADAESGEDSSGSRMRARKHLERYLELAPNGDKAEEAKRRLERTG